MTRSRPRKARKRFGHASAAVKAKIVEEWKQSGKTAADFAAGKGISRNALFVWKKEQAARASANGERGFRPVHLPTRSSESGKVIVRGRGGFRVAVDARTDEAALVVALRAISRCG